ncbi:MAG TPA: hypothetical protein VHB48_10895 [Chitinophagaceae bacterium]|nr:hypothetical protein [Chitinophagaceae bacterium]
MQSLKKQYIHTIIFTIRSIIAGIASNNIEVVMINTAKSNILLVPFAVLTTSVVALSVFVQILLQSSLNDMKADQAVMNIAIKQRTVSHQVVNAIAADNLAGKITYPLLETVLQEFYNTHQILFTISKDDSQDSIAYFTQLANVDTAYKHFSAVILKNIGSNTDNNDKFLELLNSQADYIKQLDAFMAVVTGNSNARVERFKAEELILTLFVLTIILLEVVFIFLPAIRKIKKQSQQFRAIAFSNSHIIRQPLANIKGLLEIVDKASLTEETTEILLLIKGETDKLDDAIKTNISNTAAGK